jgi:hypothetical protein
VTKRPSRRSAASAVSRSSRSISTASSRSSTASGARGARSSAIAPLIAPISVGVVPQQPPISLAPSDRAWAANSEKYSGVAWGYTMRLPDMLARTDVRHRRQRQ